MEAIIVVAGTTATINGIPVRFPVDTIVETAYENMQFTTGYHYAHVHESEAPVEVQ